MNELLFWLIIAVCGSSSIVLCYFALKADRESRGLTITKKKSARASKWLRMTGCVEANPTGTEKVFLSALVSLAKSTGIVIGATGDGEIYIDHLYELKEGGYPDILYEIADKTSSGGSTQRVIYRWKLKEEK